MSAGQVCPPRNWPGGMAFQDAVEGNSADSLMEDSSFSGSMHLGPTGQWETHDSKETGPGSDPWHAGPGSDPWNPSALALSATASLVSTVANSHSEGGQIGAAAVAAGCDSLPETPCIPATIFAAVGPHHMDGVKLIPNPALAASQQTLSSQAATIDGGSQPTQPAQPPQSSGDSGQANSCSQAVYLFCAHIGFRLSPFCICIHPHLHV